MVTGYLVDTSVWQRLRRSDEVRRRLIELRRVPCYVSSLVLLESGTSARSAQEHDQIINDLVTSMHWVYFSRDVERRAVEIQRSLVERNYHRAVRLADVLIASTAEANDLTVLHYDRDFDLITEVTDIPTEWVVKRGSVD